MFSNAKHAKTHSITNVSSVPVDKQSCGISLSSFTVTILTSPSSEEADSLDNRSSLSYLQIQSKLLLETSIMCSTVQTNQIHKLFYKGYQKTSILVKLAVHFPLAYIISALFFKHQL